ncbi:MAG: 4Fe-4S binding protein [Actinomycetia bacterium]|nr:4Fe-4S binding protein [Actinomycetes bacterium]
MPWLIGYPRDSIAWFPTIDPDECVKCGICMNCSKGVLRMG